MNTVEPAYKIVCNNNEEATSLQFIIEKENIFSFVNNNCIYGYYKQELINNTNANATPTEELIKIDIDFENLKTECIHWCPSKSSYIENQNTIKSHIESILPDKYKSIILQSNKIKFKKDITQAELQLKKKRNNILRFVNNVYNKIKNEY